MQRLHPYIHNCSHSTEKKGRVGRLRVTEAEKVWVIILLSGVQTLTYQLSAYPSSIHLYFLACCDDEYGP